MGMMSEQSWNTIEEAETALQSLNFPSMLPVEMEVSLDEKPTQLFSTTTLQIEAFRKLHLLPGRTMTTARSPVQQGTNHFPLHP